MRFYTGIIKTTWGGSPGGVVCHRTHCTNGFFFTDLDLSASIVMGGEVHPEVLQEKIKEGRYKLLLPLELLEGFR